MSVTKKYWLAGITLLLGLAARFWVGRFGVNSDFDAYLVDVDILRHGQNVYASTSNYNYGPVWFNILGALDWLAGHEIHRFRHLLVAFLSAADIGIFWVLWRRYGHWPAVIFFLNPVSVIITGMHNQFDNAAVLIGLLAMLRYGDDFDGKMNRQKIYGLLLLGLSLMTKHILFVFPLWLAIKQKGWLNKMFVGAIPVAVFLLGFAPYWSAGSTGIIEHVFRYNSAEHDTRYFYHWFIPASPQPVISAKALWMALLIGAAFACKKMRGLDALLIYTAVMTACAPATANQYLAIPAAFAAVRLNPFSVAFFAIGAVQLCLSLSGFNLQHRTAANPFNCLDAAILCLVLALAWVAGKFFLCRPKPQA